LRRGGGASRSASATANQGAGDYTRRPGKSADRSTGRSAGSTASFRTLLGLIATCCEYTQRAKGNDAKRWFHKLESFSGAA
jgi:hypothetical protein